MVPFKLKDSLTFGNNELPITTMANQQLRSKLLNRLTHMLPENTTASWLNESNKNLPLNGYEPTKSRYNSLNHYKRDYLSKFDELNGGFEDSYSMSKGGALLQITKNNSVPLNATTTIDEPKNLPSQNLPSFSYNQFLPEAPSNSKAAALVRNHDLRSAWIPKKFEGRNMFTSHIGSTLFPESYYEPQTDYYQSFDSNEKAKKVFDNPPYENVNRDYENRNQHQKTVRYSMNQANQYVPIVRWLPPQDDLPRQPRESILARSMYQADFETPVQSFPSARKVSNEPPRISSNNPKCKSVMIQMLMQNNSKLRERYEQKATMASLNGNKNISIIS